MATQLIPRDVGFLPIWKAADQFIAAAASDLARVSVGSGFSLSDEVVEGIEFFLRVDVKSRAPCDVGNARIACVALINRHRALLQYLSSPLVRAAKT